MSIPYRTRRSLNRLGFIASIVVIVAAIAWLCWVVWLQRYVVYTDDGAMLDFALSSNDIIGEKATPPVAEAKVSIFYNEGADAIDTTHELAQINGYYITNDQCKSEMENLMVQIERLSSGTAMMLEMKGPYGSFFYDTKLGDATISASTDIPAVERLAKRLKSKGFYTIARISAFRDREYGDKNVPCGLYMLSHAGLWMDQGGMYWLDPTNAAVTSWITSVVLELRDMGFDEVMLDNFAFPPGDQYIFNGDKTEALSAAAKQLMSTCGSSKFVLSFGVTDPAFALPEGRCRMYLTSVDANTIAQTVSQVQFDDPEIRLVLLCETGDTRYDEYSVLRSLNVAEEVEARKAEDKEA